jgi:hypothetical protein
MSPIYVTKQRVEWFSSDSMATEETGYIFYERTTAVSKNTNTSFFTTLFRNWMKEF